MFQRQGGLQKKLQEHGSDERGAEVGEFEERAVFGKEVQYDEVDENRDEVTTKQPLTTGRRFSRGRDDVVMCLDECASRDFCG